MSSPKPIVLVGLPGSGKSTVARQLGKRLGLAPIDTDDLIERRLGEPIRQFFERVGEPAFRDLESEVLADALLGLPRAGLISTGGGIVLRQANRDLLREHATVVYLVASPEDLARRLRHDTKRPLLQVEDPLGKLRELHRIRDPLYREVARFCIDAGRSGVRSSVGLVQMQLELAGCLPDPVLGNNPDSVQPPAN